MEETGIRSWAFREGFERTVAYTYIRFGRRRDKNVIYYLAEVFDGSNLKCSREHMEDPSGRWSYWGSFEQIRTMLCHARTRLLFSEADAWLRSRDTSLLRLNSRYWEHANGSVIPRQTQLLPAVDDVGGPKPLTSGAVEVTHEQGLAPYKRTTHDPWSP